MRLFEYQQPLTASTWRMPAVWQPGNCDPLGAMRIFLLLRRYPVAEIALTGVRNTLIKRIIKSTGNQKLHGSWMCNQNLVENTCWQWCNDGRIDKTCIHFRQLLRCTIRLQSFLQNLQTYGAHVVIRYTGVCNYADVLYRKQSVQSG